MDRNAPMTIPPEPPHDVVCSRGQNQERMSSFSCILSLDRTDSLTLVDVANDFVGEKENRKQLFGKFSVNDIPNKFSISSKSTQAEN